MKFFKIIVAILILMIISFPQTACKKDIQSETYKIRCTGVFLDPEDSGYSGYLHTVQVAIIEDGYAKYVFWSDFDAKNRWGILAERNFEFKNNEVKLSVTIGVTLNNKNLSYTETNTIHLINTKYKSDNKQEYFLWNDEPSQTITINSKNYIGTNCTVTFATC